MMIRALLTASLILNPLAAFAGPKEDAAKAIQESHNAAKKTAASLVIQDIDTLMINMARQPILSNPLTANILTDIDNLGQKIKNEIDKAGSLQEVDTVALNDLLKSYRALVRERFQVSFTAQQLVYDRELAVRTFELLFQRFNNICTVGRSEIGLVQKLPILPRIPDAQYSFNFGVGFDTDVGGGGSPRPGSGTKPNGMNIGSSSNNVSKNAEERNQAANVLYSATSIAYSMALTGGSGATVAMAAAAAPYMLGASLAVAVALYAISSHEQMLLMDEMAEANIDLMIKSANDQDIARYYKEYCSTINERFMSIQNKLALFSFSEQTRQELKARAEASRPARKQSRADALEIQPSRQLVELVQYDKNNQCVPVLEKKDDSVPCTKSGKILKSTYTSATYNPDSEDDKKRLAKAQEDIDAFSAKYPQSVQMDNYSDEVVDLLINQWDQTTATLEQLRLSSIDALMNTLAQRVQSYLLEVQRAKNSSWSKGEKLLGIEAKYQEQFVGFRTEFFKLLNTSVLVIFGKADVYEARKSFADFKKRYEAFAPKVYLNKNVQSLSLSVKSLENFYETL